MEVIGAEDGPNGGNKHGEGGTGAAGVRDRLSQVSLSNIGNVQCMSWLCLFSTAQQQKLFLIV